MKCIKVVLLLWLMNTSLTSAAQQKTRTKESFNKDWKFIIDSVKDYSSLTENVSGWRTVNVPHDWSVELPFDSTSPTGNGGGALRGGMGWYTKEFTVPESDIHKNISIWFDGVYCRSSVWLNGHLLGYRPNGYISFSYPLNDYLRYGKKNIIVVQVNNSQQPNSRWYSGSGIYRNVWLQKTSTIALEDGQTFITTPIVSAAAAAINIAAKISNAVTGLTISYNIFDAANKLVAKKEGQPATGNSVTAQLKIATPHLWNIGAPYLYKVAIQVKNGNKVVDETETIFGIRTFKFDAAEGFFLNGKSIKINGVCNHHDLGCLGTAFNYRAAERQLEILKGMGCNAIRTSHNPPAPELLDLCDKMGFIVMDEAFDMWQMQKTRYDYHLNFNEWHKKDLEDQVLRDRNHPCVFIWSIGNEIPEQGNNITGGSIARELAAIVRSLDTTRLVTSACDRPDTANNIIKSGALDLIGYNYHQYMYAGFPKLFPGKKFISTESVSGLETRGHYDLLPSDSIRRWPKQWDIPFTTGNPDFTISAYDNVSVPWGSTHEETWKIMKKYKFLSGQFIWTGFDYIGEPTPYPWPARSSYFGVIDMAGFPKDVYYMYQGEWTNKSVLHLLPHWNWKQGDTVDVWAYYSNATEVELFLNGKSKGIKKKQGDDLHVVWRLPYEPGTLKAISRKNGKTVLTAQVSTAAEAYKIEMVPDRKTITADGNDLSFVTVRILDKDGNLVPDANNLVQFEVSGEGTITAVDNGSQISMEKFQDNKRKAFNGMCLAILRSAENKQGLIHLKATAAGLQPAEITVATK